MKNECSIVRDILPLYIENIVSNETANFVKEHLENCSECTKEYEDLKTGTKIEKISNETQSHLEEEALKSMNTIRKKMRRKIYCVASVIAIIIIAICLLLHIFPVYRIQKLKRGYDSEQIVKALYIGSPADRRDAQAVLRLADQAFSDVSHTNAENEEKYGLLSRYATSTDFKKDLAYNEHSLELWSAHLDEDEGWIWVYYSSETFNHDGSTARGGWEIASLWKVEKNETGQWVVVYIYENA